MHTKYQTAALNETLLMYQRKSTFSNPMSATPLAETMTSIEHPRPGAERDELPQLVVRVLGQVVHPHRRRDQGDVVDQGRRDVDDGRDDVLARKVVVQEHRELLEQAGLVQDADGLHDAYEEEFCCVEDSLFFVRNTDGARLND